jgi:hypothetical protein
MRWAYTDYGGSGAGVHTHYYGDYYNATTSGSGGYHAHTPSASGWNTCADISHWHYTNPSSTSAGGTHGDHLTTPNVAHNLPMQTEPTDTDQTVDFLKSLDTGSSDYGNFTVKLNGTQVPGSPFLNLYVSESIDVDVGSLIVVGDNTLEISVTNNNHPGSPIRFALNGSISAKYYISQYS